MLMQAIISRNESKKTSESYGTELPVNFIPEMAGTSRDQSCHACGDRRSLIKGGIDLIISCRSATVCNCDGMARNGCG